MRQLEQVNFVILLVISQICSAQNKEILIVDVEQNFPIENVNIYYMVELLLLPIRKESLSKYTK
jgi:hypothetical protein